MPTPSAPAAASPMSLPTAPAMIVALNAATNATTRPTPMPSAIRYGV